MNNITNITFILDESGSMYGLESDTIGGFNSMLDKQKNEPGDAYLNTVLFNDSMRYLHKNTPIKEVSELTTKDYQAGGCTALLDTIGNTISQIDTFNNSLPDNEKPDKTIVTIITDGQENASREFSLAQIKNLIESKQKQGNWEFVFLGANIDTVSTAESIGINKKRAASFHNDAKGIQTNFSAVSNMLSSSRRGKKFSRRWKDEIDEDFNKRK